MNIKMTEKENPNFIERFTVRMPDGMRDAIAERAKENGRSMNSEVVDILNNALYLPVVGDNAVEFMFAAASDENMSTLSQEDREEVEKLLMQLIEKLALDIEKKGDSLRKAVSVIQRLKSEI